MNDAGFADVSQIMERLQELQRQIADRYMQTQSARDPLLFALLDEMEHLVLLLRGKWKHGNGASE